MNGNLSLPLLDSVRIASPCSARWEDMRGDERTRRCEQCSLSVHNISGMSRGDAEAFLRSAIESGSRVCARLYRRSDGTILTADCPVGFAAIRAKARRAAVRVAAALGITSLVTWAAARESGSLLFARSQPISTVAHCLKGDPIVPPMPAGSFVMGDIAPAMPAGKPIQGGSPGAQP